MVETVNSGDEGEVEVMWKGSKGLEVKDGKRGMGRQRRQISFH